MAKINVDLNKIKGEIEHRKKEKNIVPSRLGETVGSGVVPRDEFLNGLITSLHTGKETPSSTLIKVVENKVASKNGEKSLHTINEVEREPIQRPPLRQQQPPIDNIDMSYERDEQLYLDMEKRRKQTLAESIQGYVAPSVPNNQMRYDPMTGKPLYPQNQTQPMQINEGYLTENVKKIVDNYLIENFGHVVEEAIKSTIIEMYAEERIKSVLQENTDLIKSVIKEIVRENKEKKNSQ